MLLRQFFLVFCVYAFISPSSAASIFSEKKWGPRTIQAAAPDDEEVIKIKGNMCSLTGKKVSLQNFLHGNLDENGAELPTERENREARYKALKEDFGRRIQREMSDAKKHSLLSQLAAQKQESTADAKQEIVVIAAPPLANTENTSQAPKTTLLETNPFVWEGFLVFVETTSVSSDTKSS